MKPYTKIYMDYFGYTTADYMPCENCNSAAVDLHHINARGQGGNPAMDKNTIDNLMALCRKCHLFYGDKKKYKEFLLSTHRKFMAAHGKG